ncbi:TfuA-like protein [Streptomyces sp. NPDC008343]|uniref:TfuA-like protein n=1 Tax=Streptomyces sp. NPDC008343 TaxID=3364828 RepID=UPI0036E60D3F
MTVHVFHGPALAADEVQEILPTARRYPPVRHGDLLVLDAQAGDLVLIIDGVFHSVAPVRHKEILWLLSRGVAVAGAASVDALRAAELHPYGMRGVGRIFTMYREGTIDGDEEVAVAHSDMTEGFRSLTVALVDVRAALEDCVRSGTLPQSQADRLLELARAIPYPQRSLTALRRAVEHSPDTINSSSVEGAWLWGQNTLLSEKVPATEPKGQCSSAVRDGTAAPTTLQSLFPRSLAHHSPQLDCLGTADYGPHHVASGTRSCRSLTIR